MNTQITAAEIFGANQVLTLEAAKKLIGKKIAVTNAEYKGNQASVRIGTIIGIESAWDLAKQTDHAHLDGGKYATRQDYWLSYMGDLQIEQAKNKLVLVADAPLYATCDLKDTWSFPEPTFFGSDSEREIYYLEVEEDVIIKHSTKGYFQQPNNWISTEKNAVQWASRFSLNEAEKIAKTLTGLDGKLLKKIELIRFKRTEPEFGFNSYELVRTIENA